MELNDFTSLSTKRKRKNFKCGLCGKVETSANWVRHFVTHHDSCEPVEFIESVTQLDLNIVAKVQAKSIGHKFKRGHEFYVNKKGATIMKSKATILETLTQRPPELDILSVGEYPYKRQRGDNDLSDDVSC